MSVTIDNELLTFDEKLSGSLGTISSGITTLTSKVEEINSASSSVAADITSNYQGDGLSSALASIASLQSAVDGIKAGIESGPTKAISMAQSLLDEIKTLKEVKEEIGKLESEKSSAQNSDATDKNTRVNDLNSKIQTKEKEFNEKHEQAKTSLSELKSLNPTVDAKSVSTGTDGTKTDNDTGTKSGAVQVQVDSGTGEIRADLLNLQEGRVNTLDYVGKNGKTIRTFIYVPVGAKTTTGLGVTLSLGGDGSKNAEGSKNEPNKGRGGLGAGVGKQLAQGAKYSGIVVVLEAYNDKSYSDPNYLSTAKELTDNIVKTYKADSNKISISGYSYGAYGTEHMLTKYPSYFSQAVILAGGHGVTAGSTKIHYIIGSKDGVYQSVVSGVKPLTKDSKITLEVRQGSDHGINSFRPITINGKEYANYVEFCLAQTKGAQ